MLNTRILPWLALLVCVTAQAADWQYVTAPGDTLIGIGQRYLKNPNDWPRIQSENKVAIPRQMPSQFRLRIPVALLKTTPASVEVMAVSGNVRYKPVDAGYQPLKPGVQLNGGETVLTGPRSSASFRFADGTQLTQQAGSKLVFGRLVAYGKTGMVSTELDLGAGRIEATAGKQQMPAGGFKVRTLVAVAGVRGTDFRVAVSEDGQRMSSEVSEGSVAVSRVTSQSTDVMVAAGFGSIAEAGKAPSAPRPLLAAPEWSKPQSRVRKLPLEFSWSAHPDARAWRAQLAEDADFRKLVIDEVVGTPTIQWQDDLPDGAYFLRVRAIDAEGLEGLSSTHAFTLDAHPLPPPLAAPSAGQRVTLAQTALSWSAVPGAQGYILQLARDAGFSGQRIERRLPAVAQHQETLDEGEWHWRMASIGEDGQPRAYGSTRSFHVQPLPVPPQDGSANASDGQVRFAWGSVRGAERYALEVRPQNKSDALHQETPTPAASLSLNPGRYVWRVRGLEADGLAGAWSRDNVLLVPPLTPQQLQVMLQSRPLRASWQGNAARYRVEIAQDAGFGTILHRLESTQSSLDLPDLLPGSYHARVVALDADGNASLPSGSHNFSVKRDIPVWLLPFMPLLLLAL